MAVTFIKSHNIISPLGFSSEENMNAVMSGAIGLKHYKENTLGVPEAFFASQINWEFIDAAFSKISQNNTYSRFEKLAILSVYNATSTINIDLANDKTFFVLSTTKGNIDGLENLKNENFKEEQILLWHSAFAIARFFGNKNQPAVVSNACISGISAQIVAKRLLNTNKYNHVVVVGGDLLSKFVISGFQSFKALSVEACKPFDANRVGLNLGEGAATLVLAKSEAESDLAKETIVLEAGAITNDANHISGPSRTGEGLFLALQAVMKSRKAQEIGFINAHGTATPYNDEMESIALSRAGLTEVPVNSLKGYFGHTLGAAGLIETVIASESLRLNQLIKSAGYETSGVTYPLNMITKSGTANISRCIKMASGFGGCNAAIILKKVC